MDLNNIFNLFNDDDDQSNIDETSLLIDFSEHPLFWVSGFNKIIDNHLFFKNYTIKAFQKTSLDLNIEDLRRAGEEFMFRRAWDYIKDIDLEKPLHIECIQYKASKKFVDNLQTTIYFFEVLEEYEKCALLKNIELKVKSFLN
jgi:hypothetical protein